MYVEQCPPAEGAVLPFVAFHYIHLLQDDFTVSDIIQIYLNHLEIKYFNR